jgi:hypothetical protein
VFFLAVWSFVSFVIQADSKIQLCQYHFCDQLLNIPVMFSEARWLRNCVCHIPKYFAVLPFFTQESIFIIFHCYFDDQGPFFSACARVICDICDAKDRYKLLGIKQFAAWLTSRDELHANILKECCRSRSTPKR